MCNVPLTTDKQNIDFIIYNLIFAKENESFTVESLLKEVKKYDKNITEQFIQSKIDNMFLMQGLIRQKFNKYCIKRNGWEEIK